jgi:transcriptional regulator with XRE-family HTH domain
MVGSSHGTGHAAGFGRLLREWRGVRGKSQLALATEAGVSTRHLSFVETGRASPSRDMVLTLAEALDVPLRERNALLEAAGFAPIYRSTSLDASVMHEIRHVLQRMLDASEPNPTLVVNRRYDVLLANRAMQRLIGALAPGWAGPANVIELLLAADGLRPAITNWSTVTCHAVHRVRSELATSQHLDDADRALLAKIAAAEAELRHAPSGAAATSPTPTSQLLVPTRIRHADRAIDLFSTITTLGTPLDITLQELRIESLFPADNASRRALHAICAPG